MKINELKFEAHPSSIAGTRAVAEFNNGFRASVISGDMFYCSVDKPYEIAVMDKNGVTYSTPLTDDVFGYLSEDEANKILSDIEALEKIQ